jgi:copper(I)-binding protein
VIALSAAAATALLLSGCAAGEHAGTSKEAPVVDAGSAKLGSIGINAISILAPSANSYAKGAEAPLQMYLTNDGQTADQLLGISTSAASTVRAYANAAAASEALTQAAEASDSAASSQSPSAASSPASSAADSSSAASCAPAAGFTPITIPAEGAVPIGYSDTQKVLLLQGLTASLFPAQSVQMTFAFCHAGSIEVAVPVALTPGPSTTPTVNIAPTDG